MSDGSAATHWRIVEPATPPLLLTTESEAMPHRKSRRPWLGDKR
jgi:hypothetical protein